MAKLCGMDANFNVNDIKNFLYDISLYLRNSLQSLEYENASKIEHGYNNEAKCKDLLDRCEHIMITFNLTDNQQNVEDCRNNTTISAEYLDMSAKRTATPNEYVDFNNSNQKLNQDVDNNNDDNNDDDGGSSNNIDDNHDDKEIYDVCNSSLQKMKSLDDTDNIDCPYLCLPAADLKASSKCGQLLRIEKRFIFGKTQKYFCAIMEDYLLCYSDGILLRPTFCIHLNGVNVEHFGQGKKRDICFQITDFETTKKVLFQGTSEVDTKEWIHAIEAAIRGDFNTTTITTTNTVESSTKMYKSSSVNNNLRKLPTPPIEKKLYLNSHQDAFNDSIYEEPCPSYNNNSNSERSNLIITESNKLKPPNLPIKTGLKSNNNNSSNIIKYEYDVPKPTKSAIDSIKATTEAFTEDTEPILLSSHSNTYKTEFKTKLSNHLSSGPSPDRIKFVKKSPQLCSTSDTKKNTKGQLLFKDKDKDKDKDKIVSNTTSNSTPVKNWFLNRLNKTSPQSMPKVKSIEKEKENLLSCPEGGGGGGGGVVGGGGNTFTPKSSKGGKVNMIINQLEANGHLPIFTRNFERLSSAFIDSGEDCSYEPIMTTGNGKF